MPNIVVVQGSTHEKSSTAAMLRFASATMEELGASVAWIDLRETPLPIFSSETRRTDPEYLRMRSLIEEADAILLGTPDYHGGPSGAMKNFLDYFWREFTGKLFGYVCASHEKGLTPMDMLRVHVRQCYGWSLPYGVSGAEGEDVEPEGGIRSEKLRERLTMLAHDLVKYARVLATQRQDDLASSDPGFLAILRR